MGYGLALVSLAFLDRPRAEHRPGAQLTYDPVIRIPPAVSGITSCVTQGHLDYP
jgi:hypothetical protein